jgi:hypothetical protein
VKTVRVILSPEAEEVYKHLNEKASTSKLERSILNSVNKKVELIKANFHYGEPIAKEKIPQEYRQKYGINNLFWVELSGRWRMLYSLNQGETEIEIVAFVLDISDHGKYDKTMGYKRK